MTFGRPHAISEDHVRLSLPAPFDEDPVSAGGTNTKLTSVNFFVESMWGVLEICRHRHILMRVAESYIKCSTRSFQPYTNKT